MKRLRGKDKNRTDRILWLVIFIVSTFFYLIWYWMDGIILTEDAQSYITMTSDREPGYCIFLAAMRFVFGGGALHAAVIVQCIVAAVAAAALALGLKKRFSLNYAGMLLILFIQYGVTLLNRFVAQRRYSYYNSIETEGLCYSFWIFFFLGILGIVYDHSRKSTAAAVLWSIVLISIRKQMLITLVILVLCLLYTGWKESVWKRALVSALLSGVGVLAMTTLIDCSYNLAVRGVFTSHSGDSSFILGTELYLADQSMENYLQTDERRELFQEIMRRTEEQEYNIDFVWQESQGGIRGSFLWNWQAIENHYSMSYDRIKFDVVMAVIREHQEKIGVPEDRRPDNYNEIAGSMMKELFVPCIPDLIRLFVCNVIHGMITTILKVHRILNWAAVLLYSGYVFLIVYLKRKGVTDGLPFAAVVILAIVVNVCFTSLTIYPQMRYMLYNTALFYQAGAVMCIQGWGQKELKETGSKLPGGGMQHEI